ncbi:pol [Symbiodinium sp. CCMP2592]|nr:pol [Symbiodinium sp. CCMP2592]
MAPSSGGLDCGFYLYLRRSWKLMNWALSDDISLLGKEMNGEEKSCFGSWGKASGNVRDAQPWVAQRLQTLSAFIVRARDFQLQLFQKDFDFLAQRGVPRTIVWSAVGAFGLWPGASVGASSDGTSGGSNYAAVADPCQSGIGIASAEDDSQVQLSMSDCREDALAEPEPPISQLCMFEATLSEEFLYYAPQLQACQPACDLDSGAGLRGPSTATPEYSDCVNQETEKTREGAKSLRGLASDDCECQEINKTRERAKSLSGLTSANCDGECEPDCRTKSLYGRVLSVLWELSTIKTRARAKIESEAGPSVLAKTDRGRPGSPEPPCPSFLPRCRHGPDLQEPVLRGDRGFVVPDKDYAECSGGCLQQGKGEGAVQANVVPQAVPVAPDGKGKAKGKHKSAGSGDAARNVDSANPSGKDAWKLVERKPKTEEPFELRQQDSDANMQNSENSDKSKQSDGDAKRQCTSKRPVNTLVQYRQALHNHLAKHHNGAGLPGRVTRPKVSKDHRASHHPEIPPAEWSAISRVQPTPFAQLPEDTRRTFAEGVRTRRLAKTALKEVRAPRFPGLQTFVWPVAKYQPGGKAKHAKEPGGPHIKRISLEHGWKCLACGVPSKDLPTVKLHAKGKCRPLHNEHAVRKRRIKHFRTMHQWVLSAKLPSKEKTTLCTAIDAAIVAVDHEVDINKQSAPGYVAEWRRKGYSAILSPLDEEVHAHSRIAAGLVEVKRADHFEHVLVVAVYGFPGDEAATAVLVQDLLRAIHCYGGCFVVLGDFNTTQEENAVGKFLQQGLVRSLDEAGGRLFADLPFVSLDDIPSVTSWVAGLTEDFALQEKKAAVQQWQDRVCTNEKLSTRWIKRKADEKLQQEAQAPDLAKHAGAVHPAAFLRDQAEVWTKQWTAPERHIDLARVEEAFRCLPDASTLSTGVISLSVETLRASAAAMRNKAAGPDQWTAEQLLRLPTAWWEAFLQLWLFILQNGSVPECWRRVIVTLVRKPAGGTRPLGLCSIAWRVGTRAINRSLRGWVQSWAEHGALGAAPARGVGDAHARLMLARRAGARHFLKQDLSHFFDSIHVGTAVHLLNRLGAPPELGRLLVSFYGGQQRLFKHERYLHDQWTPVSIGCIQGCPLSPTIALAFGHLWSRFCATPGTNNLIFIDDRVLWPLPGSAQPARLLDAALDKSTEFDSIFGFKCRPSKCAVAQPPGEDVLTAFASAKGYEVQHTLEILGIVMHLEEESNSLLPMRGKSQLMGARLLVKMLKAALDDFILAVIIKMF